ncbi:Vta1 like-domain-containing protein [Lophiotrema nucula]|uniref:Vta1 like-domain-containing protein n=1 Tax=Lophiotrema nucula TaxID=690887 RepID=A0A6A5ZHM6_9PLEO|nr:Vta1 like-domain-containing protein [Lophiotrema nucula]
MATNTPAKLRGAEIAQFAYRAGQLEQYKPIITYWLRFYMTQKIIAKGLHNADEECNAYTVDLMDKLEHTKAEHSTEDALLDEVAAYAYCEQFALETFARGDNAIRSNKVTAQTVDTFRAAATFFEMLTIWKNPLETEIASKLKFAKFHAVRIAKALKAGEDPNASNPVQENPPEPMSPALDPADPEVQRITGGAVQPPAGNPYQSYVESAPNTEAQPSPTFSVSRVSPPPPQLPSAPTGYSHAASPPVFPSHRDVSPISQPDTSRHGSVASVGGGYFPRVNQPPPTFTSETAAPGLPTAPSIEDEPMTAPFESPPPQIPQAPQAPSPQAFYQNQASPPPIQPPHQPPPSQQLFQHQQPGFASPPPPQQPQFQHNPVPPQQQQPWIPPTFHNQPPPQQYSQPAPPPPPAQQALSQGPFKTDEEAVIAAEKHAKWAISALHFEDINTAVKELRIALQSLGAL